MIHTRIARLLWSSSLLALAMAPRPGFAQTPSPVKVVVVSLDAFGAASLAEPKLPMPTLHALMKNGVYASSMRPINPTVTWPNHTSMVTGVDATCHHVLMNGLIVHQRTDRAPSVDARASKAQLVPVKTLYEAAFQQGMVTAEVDWVAILQSGAISWSFAEDPVPDSPIARELIAQGQISADELRKFHAPSQAWRDRIYTQAAVDIIRQHHPDLLLVHLLALDSIEHETGFGNNAGRNTLAFLDDRLKEIIDAVRANGELDRTAFFIVSDHGQQSYHHRLDPNALLRKAGLASGDHAAFALGELVYQKDSTPESIERLRKVFEGQPGIERVLTPAQASEAGLPTPAQSTQAPDLYLFAADDYEFGHNPNGEPLLTTEERGSHGYANSKPFMQAIFVASGAGIRPAGNIGPISNLNLAPTIARLMHLQMPPMQAEALDILNKR